MFSHMGLSFSKSGCPALGDSQISPPDFRSACGASLSSTKMLVVAFTDVALSDGRPWGPQHLVPQCDNTVTSGLRDCLQ